MIKMNNDETYDIFPLDIVYNLYQNNTLRKRRKEITDLIRKYRNGVIDYFFCYKDYSEVKTITKELKERGFSYRIKYKYDDGYDKCEICKEDLHQDCNDCYCKYLWLIINT